MNQSLHHGEVEFLGWHSPTQLNYKSYYVSVRFLHFIDFFVTAMIIGLVTALPYFIVTSFWIFSLDQNHGVKKVFSNAYNYCIIISRDKIVQIVVHYAFL